MLHPNRGAFQDQRSDYRGHAGDTQSDCSETSRASVVSSSAGFFAYPVTRFNSRLQRHVTRTTLGRGRSVDSEMFGYTEGSVPRDPTIAEVAERQTR
jgi:hypothetical protein